MDESEARTFVGAANITAVAVNAGVYKIYLVLNDVANYGWLENAGDAQGVLTLTWTIGKMKVALPTAGKNNFVVNGNAIVYIPEGFDESIMSIEHNVQSYGGNFTAIVTLKDTANYEWADGSTSVALKWHITGANVLLAIILSLLGVCTVAGAAGIATQVLVEKHRKRTEAAALAEIESKDLADGESANAEAGAASETTEAGKSEEKVEEKAEDNPEEKADDKAEDKPEEKADDKAEDKPEEKADDKAEDKAKEKAEEKPEGKSEGKTEAKKEAKPKSQQGQKPKPKSGNNTSKGNTGKGGKKA